jgi:cyclophilin family peptidyl-prolyl cis-trans isomerase
MHPSKSALVVFAALLAAVQTTNAGTVVQFRTVFGTVDVELYDTEKPITSANFLRYVADGSYTDMFFHRVVPNFVIQGGGFRAINRGATNAIAARIAVRPSITNEYGVGPFLSNEAGTIAMAKSPDPNSASSQFFFNLRNNAASLDNTNNAGGFTVFGRVIRGTNVLEKWNGFTRYNSLTTPTNAQNLIVDARNANPETAAYGELPVLQLRTATNGSRFLDIEDLVYCDISLLNVQVAHRSDGAAEIRWNPVAGRTNFVEFTTEFPPVWQALTNLPPEALPAKVYSGPAQPSDDAVKTPPTLVIDPNGDPNRFYRVRATY